MNILITGGAGFIGSRLTTELHRAGHQLTLIDNLSAQVHGPSARFSDELVAISKTVLADIGDRAVLQEAMHDKDVIIHLAAETGTGQSMYDVQHYTKVNLQGTAAIMDVLVNDRPKRLRKIIVASSRAVYGEGKYQCVEDGVVYPATRSAASMSRRQFEPVCPKCGLMVTVLPTSEDTPFAPSSYYGLTKQVQEQMILMFGAAIGLDAIALRYQNVFGPGQSLCNPYTGLLAVFSNLVRERLPIQIFEDGLESRDFVYVDDVVAATVGCVAPEITGVHSLNVGSGERTTVLQVAEAIRAYFGSNVPLEVTGAFRYGDIRHGIADSRRIEALTGFQPKWKFIEGLHQFLRWAEQLKIGETGFEKSLGELAAKGLFVATR